MELTLTNIGKRWKGVSGIYRIEINNKFYIGSSKNLNARLKEHERDLRKNIHNNKYLQRAFNKYKKCTFTILELCKVEDLVEKEYFWFQKQGIYNILDPKKRTGNKQCKKVYQYDLNGKLLATFPSTGEAARQTNSTQTAISNCCSRDQNLKYHNGYLWSYKKETVSRKTKVAKKVFIYNLNGNFLRSFYSVEEASKKIAKEENIENYLSISSHARVCAKTEKGSLLKKYQLRYYKLDKIPEFKPFHKNSYNYQSSL